MSNIDWETGVDFPPIGSNVELRHGDGSWNGPGEVFHTTKRGVCFVEYENGGWDKTVYPERVRPIQSHRDKVIEAALKAVSDARCWQCSREDLEVLYDAGSLKLPEEK